MAGDMGDIEQLKRALVNADRAGDVEAARKFAQAIRQQMSVPSRNEKPEKYDPTDGMTTTQKVLAGVGKAMADAGRGVGQMLGVVSQEDVDRAKELDKPLMNTGAGTVGNVIGNIATLAPTMLIPGANTVKGAALINGLAGGALTPGTLEDRAQAAGFGAGGSAAGVGAAKLIAGTSKAVSAAAAPFSEEGRKKIIGEVMRRAAGDNADAVAARLRNAQELVPGSLPTAAEVADSGGIAALQRAMSAANPEAYAYRGMSNNAARVDSLRGIAKDEQAMQQAIAARAAAANPLYAAADNAVVTSDDALRSIMGRLPSGTLEQAQNIARMSGRPIKIGKDIPASQVTTGQIDIATGLPITQQVAGQNAKYTGRGLDLIKKAIDDVVDSSPTAPIAKNARGQAVGVKNDLVAWADQNIPEYAAARQAWADRTVQISQMQIGQELLNKVQPALVQYHPSGAQFRQAGGAYANALNDVRGTLVKNSTGGMRKNLEDVMTPEQMQTLNNIAADLSRGAFAADAGRGVGSNTFQNFAMDNLASQVGMPSAVSAIANLVPGLGRVSQVGKALGNTLYKSKDELMKGQMADLLLNPQAAADVMESAAKPSRLSQAFVDRLGQHGASRAVELGGAAPGLLGASFALPYGSQ